MAPRKLRAVLPDEHPAAPVRQPSVSEAAKSGDHRALLVAMRDRVALAVQDSECPPRDLAALTRRLNEIAKDIRALDAAAQQEADEKVPDDGEFDAASI